MDKSMNTMDEYNRQWDILTQLIGRLEEDVRTSYFIWNNNVEALTRLEKEREQLFLEKLEADIVQSTKSTVGDEEKR
jgi:hypothetical protein